MKTTTQPSSFPTAAAAVISSIALACSMNASALAQDALGSGNALDRNPGQGTGGQNSPQPANPYANRNAVVTGEVVGGREFRGSVGYTAPGDFRGATALNDFFRFRTDSAWSNPNNFSLGSTTYDQLRFGQSLGVLELRRNSAGATAADITAAQTTGEAGPFNFATLAQSRLQTDAIMLNATSDARQVASAEPATLGTARAQGQALAITASSVRGLSLDQYDERWANLGLTTYDQARMRDEMLAAAAGGLPVGQPAVQGSAEIAGQPGALAIPGQANPTPLKSGEKPGGGAGAGAPTAGANAAAGKVGGEFQTRFEDLRTQPRVDSKAGDGRVDAKMQSDYAKVLQRIAERYANSDDQNVQIDPKVLKELDEQYRRMKGTLNGQVQPGGQRGAAQPAGQQPRIDPVTGRPLPSQSGGSGSGQPGAVTQNPSGGSNNAANQPNPRKPQTTPPDKPSTDLTPASEGEPAKPLDVSKLAGVLRHGEKIEHLSSQEQGRLNELMVAAEEQLAKGEYMLAEQRFQRALRFSPGNPLAMAGAANAQTGAGLYLSAALTLRGLFTQHPEMIDVTYADNLLPPRERLNDAAAALRKKMETPTDRAAYALLLAYIGKQSGDKVMIAEGVDAMANDAPANDPLPALLRSVWLAEPEKPEK